MNKNKKIVGLERLTEKKFLNLYEGTYSDIDGNITKWDFASRKKLASPSDAENVSKQRKPDAVNIPVYYCSPETGEPHIILIREYRSPFASYFVSFPAGLIESGESPIEAAIRELKEEIGGKVMESANLVSFASTSAGVSNEANAVVIARVDPLLGSQHLENDEDIQVLDLTLGEAERMMDSGKEIFEMSTILILKFIIPIMRKWGIATIHEITDRGTC